MYGRVFKSTGSWYDVRTEDDKSYPCRLRGKFKLKGFKVTNPIAVGDFVDFYLEDNEEETGVINKIFPRENYIIRKAIKKSAHGHIIAANIDQAILIATLSFPETSLGFIDRFLVTAETFRIPVLLVFNKSDLLRVQEIEKVNEVMEMYEGIGYPCYLISALDEKSMDQFSTLIKGKTSLISGHSGVGKSTLLNNIIPEINQKTKEISQFAKKGVHTTTFAEMFAVDDNSFLIDTPGIKELGLVEIGNEELYHYFPEMRAFIGQCKFHNCTHTHEPKCAVLEAVEAENISLSRYYSYMSMLEGEDNRR